MRFVAVVSCPTGIANTYLAAEALETAAAAKGHEIVVETQGGALPAVGGSILRRFHAGLAPVDPDLIAAADAVVYATERRVRGRERFAGKPSVAVGVMRAVRDAPGVIDEAVAVVEAGRTP